MTSIAVRASVLALVPEVTEGTIVEPSAATQYTALQGGFTAEPGTDSLKNDEQRNSIGIAKPIVGTQKPSISLSHYLRASGVEGTAPDYNDMLKAFFGTETVNATERITAAASTTILIKVAAGTGSDFPRGTGMLIKDGTNGYRIRVSHNRSVDDITPSFKVPVAPAITVSLGKCVTYSPADTGHQTLSVWYYMGNDGGKQLVSGVRITEFGFDATAGALVNASFKGEGIAFYWNPIQITASSKYIDFQDDNGVVAAVLTERWYLTPNELASEVTRAMNVANGVLVATCTYDSTTGKFLIVSTGTLLSLLWNTGANTANSAKTKLGYSNTDDTGVAATTGYSSDTAQTYTSPYTPTIDSADPLVGKNHEVMIGDQADYVCFDASKVTFSGTLGRAVNQSLCSETGISSSNITSREGKLTVTSLLNKYDADKMSRYNSGTVTRFQYSFGTKVAGNWVAGTCGYLYLPDCTVTSCKVSEQDGLFQLVIELQPYVATAGVGEMYLGFL